ncbi:MAG TPA: ferric reductase-like transmembrane domain-containing protein [Candidatus Thermoplasmatota archaeon]|nr:ferric reductase-like transmembrane domain-containing protein [Candidatus Thermoplasmatota archaeon]
MAGGRWLGILVLALLAFGALGAMGAGEGGPVDVKKSTCWSCHSAWTPPLKQSANVIPGDAVAAEVGKTLAYNVQVQNAWRHEIRAYQLTVDLKDAPSLNFASSAAPVKDKAIPLTIPALVDPANPGAPAGGDRANTTRIDVPVPASSSHLTIAPLDTSAQTGPTLVGLVTAPDGTTTETPAAGPGQAIEVADPFNGQSGAFRAGAKVTGPSPGSPGLPAVGAVPFTVTYSAAFELDALRQVPISVPTFLDKGKIQLLGGLNFTVTKEPAAGEHIRFWFNSTVHYTHTNSRTQGGDWANWTQAPVDVPVELVGSKVELKPVNTGPIVRIPPLNGPTLTTASEAIGYASAFLIVSSIASGGMFGKASRRGMNNLFGSAKRRVAFHNFLSYGIILVALVHMVLFLFDGDYKWTRGLIWGGLSILAMLGLGVTGALQVPMIRRWSYGAWRWTHYGMTVAVIVLTILHMLLEGAHFGDVQAALHYSDPFNPVQSA